MKKCLHRVAILAALTTGLTACSTEHEFRVGAIGDDSATSENTAIAGSAPFVVVAGNILLGQASQLALVSGPGTNSGVVDGTVSAVLLTTGQSLIELSDGTSLLVNSTSGALGDLVSVDLGAGQVVGGSTTLIGANVLGTTSTGTLSGTDLSTGTMIGSATGGGTSVLPTGSVGSTLGIRPTTTTIGTVSGSTGTATGIIGPVCC